MQQMIKNLIATDYSVLAHDLYDFVERRGVLPTQDQIMYIFKESEDLEDVAQLLNSLFVDCTREALLSAFSDQYREAMRTQLSVRYIDGSNADEDEICILFYNRMLDYADTAVLEDFYLSLKAYERDFLSKNLCLQTTFAINEVPRSLIDRLLAIESIDSFLYQSVVEPTDGRENETCLLHLGLLMRQYRLNRLSSAQIVETQEVLRPYIGSIFPQSEYQFFYAEFIVMTLKNT